VASADTRTSLRVKGARPIAALRRAHANVPWPVVGAVSVGGVVGAEARYAVGSMIHPGGGEFPWGTFTVNVSGCLLIGVLMVLISDMWPSKRLLRPFLGTGVLGGYTTFSTYIVDIQRLVAAGAARTALAYLAATVVGALLAVQFGLSLTRLAIGRIHHRKESR
jgi:CrcB protein